MCCGQPVLTEKNWSLIRSRRISIRRSTELKFIRSRKPKQFLQQELLYRFRDSLALLMPMATASTTEQRQHRFQDSPDLSMPMATACMTAHRRHRQRRCLESQDLLT